MRASPIIFWKNGIFSSSPKAFIKKASKLTLPYRNLFQLDRLVDFRVGLGDLKRIFRLGFIKNSWLR